MREEAVRAMQLAVGLIPAFAVAGLFEGLVTPSDAIPEPLKVLLGVAAAAVFWLYLLLGGRELRATGERPSNVSSSKTAFPVSRTYIL